MIKIRVADLQYALFPTATANPRWAPLFSESYRLWQAVWTDTLKELDGSDKVFSDDFCRQSYAGAIFCAEKCLALGLFHEVDFRVPSTAADSYFKVWPPGAIAKLTKDGPNILVGSNITIDSNYRGDLGEGLRLKHLLLGLMVKTLLNSPCDAMTGTMRCDRNMHNLANKLGATHLQSGVIHHGVEVELMSWYRKGLGNSEFQFDLSIETLWRHRLDYRGTTNERLKKTSHR